MFNNNSVINTWNISKAIVLIIMILYDELDILFSFPLQLIEPFYSSFLKSATKRFNLVVQIFDVRTYIEYHRNWIMTQQYAILLSVHVFALFNLSTRTLFRITISITLRVDKKYIRLNLSFLFNAYNKQPMFAYMSEERANCTVWGKKSEKINSVVKES